MSKEQYVLAADEAALGYGIPPELFHSLIQTESSWNQGAVSSAGAIGLTQLMPGTARELGVDAYDSMDNLRGGAKYLSKQKAKFGNWCDALTAYNAGPGNVDTGSAAEKEGRQYAAKVYPEGCGAGGYSQSVTDWVFDSTIGRAGMAVQDVIKKGGENVKMALTPQAETVRRALLVILLGIAIIGATIVAFNTLIK